LHNLDPEWDPPLAQVVIDEIESLTCELRSLGHPVTPVTVTDDNVAAALAPYDPGDHIVFNWCEELPQVPRSDARVARVLEALGYAYTGATAPVLAGAWNKPRIKRILEGCGLATPHGRVYTSPTVDDWTVFPAIVKPAWEHCSIGVDRQAVVLTPDELTQRVAQVLRDYAQPALVEDFIDGREFRVCLWGNGALEALPIAEMGFAAFDDVRDRLCVYDAKFEPESRPYRDIELLLPAPLSEDEQRRVADLAIPAYRAVGCRDYGRLDLRLRGDTFYILDVNPNPDLANDGSLIVGAEEIGYTQADVVSRLVNLAAERHPRFSSG
jgi:D-alanine-D-alanine ligase